MPKSDRPWEGGYIRLDARGRDVYVIRRAVAGKRYEISTRCHAPKQAYEQLRRFEADPESYSPNGARKKAPLYLDTALAAEFLEWNRDIKKNSMQWLTTQRWCLAWWADKLKGQDIRAPELVHKIQALLAKGRNRHHRIAVLKAFYGWLRKEKHTITAAEDPTFQTVSVPQAKPEQWVRMKAIPKAHYLKVRKHLAEHWRDAMDVQAGTGWHVTETIRFSQGGAIEKYPGNDKKVAGVLVCPTTKAGEPLKTAVSAEVLAAARRLRARETMTYKYYWAGIQAACRKAKVEAFTPGRFRHSVATWAVNQGADPASVAAFLNHRDSRTTRRFYATHAVPAKVPTLR
jgi:site-specific recombinase XerD